MLSLHESRREVEELCIEDADLGTVDRPPLTMITPTMGCTRLPLCP